MEDVLSVLRQYNVQKKEIVTEGDRVVFGESSWPKNAPTNYVVSGTGEEEEEGQPEERYYTLHSVLFLLANERLAHPSYVLLAAAQSVPVVREPDREAMLAYLNGEEGSTLMASTGGGSAFTEMTVERKGASDEVASSPSSSPSSSSPAEAASSPRAKRARVEDEERPAERERPAVRLEAHRRGGADRIGSSPSVENQCSDADDLDDLDHLDQPFGATPPAESRALFHHQNVVTLKNRRSVDAGGGVTTALQGHVSREVVWGDRNTVLQSTKNQDFSKNILAILQSVRAKEKREQDAARTDHPSVRKNQPVSAERLTGKTQTAVFNNVDTAEGFYEEDTTLTSVTEGAPASPQPLPRPAIPQSNVHPPPKKQQNRASRTPIIVVPAGSTSLITMANAKDLLQDATFVTAEEKRRRGVPRDREVLLQHRRKDSDSTGATVPYRVTDQPFKLSAADWERVVAVFVAGPAWQFKGWPPRLLPPGGSPRDVFARIPAFHLKYHDAPTDANVARWDVTVLEVSRRQRHLDRPAAMRFWEALERHMVQHKPLLRY